MDEIQVDIVHPKLREGGVDGARDVINVVDDFGGDIEGISREARLFDGDADFWFGVV